MAPVGELAEETFTDLRDLVAQECGVFLGAEKRNFLERRVNRRLPQLGLDDAIAYLEYIRYHTGGRHELIRLVESIAVLETHFFRHVEQFELLETEVLPELIRKRTGSGRRRFRAWSAGCATGEEAYSIAIAFAKTVGRLAPWDVEVLGTDLCHGFIERAREGLYAETAFREVPPHLLVQWLTPERDKFRISRDIVDVTFFRTHNLVRDGFPYQMDVIFCRNVMIYFEREVAVRVVAQIKNSLAVGGVLFIGSAETLENNYEQMSTITNGAAVAYRRLS